MNKVYSVLLMAILALSACDEKEDFTYDIPTSYSFDNVDYSGQQTRITMLAELVDLAKTGNSGETVDANMLQSMFENSGSVFTSDDLNNASKDLKSKTFELDQPLIESFFTKIELASMSAGATGMNGQAGIVSSLDGSRTYLFDENGYEYAQLIEKGLMGACFYYQILGGYLTAEKIGASVDNKEVIEGEGTAMEHHWDEAFGYTSLPENYPNHSDELHFWGEYIEGREDLLNSGSKIMNAFIAGRAAISANDMDTKNEQIDIIYSELELVAGGTAIHYINSALNAYTDDALRNHTLSEAWAFINALQYNPKKSMSTQEVLEARALLGDNFYEVSRTDLTEAKQLIATALNLNAIADQL